jgi:hypothetical protein
MTQDNAPTEGRNGSYGASFASFAAIGGFDYEGESLKSMRIFGNYESALDYARDLINGRFGYDYAYVAGVNADGSLATKDVTRVADDEPSVVSL